MSVRRDGARRVVGVTVHRLPDELRTPAALAAAFRDALVADAAAAYPPAPLVLDAAGQPVVRRAERPPRPDLRAIVEAASREAAPDVRTLARLGSRPSLGGEVGRSQNGLVEAVLDASGSGGEIVVEPSWLTRARIADVGAAITQAFTAAYQERDER